MAWAAAVWVPLISDAIQITVFWNFQACNVPPFSTPVPIEDGRSSARWLQSHPNHASRENLKILLSRWGDREPGPALRWASAHLSAELRSALLPNLLAALWSESAMQTLLATPPASSGMRRW